MKLHVGPIPESSFVPDSNWRSLREPGPLLMQVFALPLAFALGIGFFQAWLAVGIPTTIAFRSADHSWPATLLLLLSFPAIIVAHELLHAFTYPQKFSSDDVVIGVWPRRGLFYAHYHGVLTRNRFLLVFLMPLLVISVLPLLIAAVVPLKTWLLLALAWCSVWNAIFACGDVFGVLLILVQVPRRGLCRNRGYRTYWQIAKSGNSTPPTCQAADEQHA